MPSLMAVVVETETILTLLLSVINGVVVLLVSTFHIADNLFQTFNRKRYRTWKWNKISNSLYLMLVSIVREWYQFAHVEDRQFIFTWKLLKMELFVHVINQYVVFFPQHPVTKSELLPSSHVLNYLLCRDSIYPNSTNQSDLAWINQNLLILWVFFGYLGHL